jgi:hypothetical protein
VGAESYPPCGNGVVTARLRCVSHVFRMAPQGPVKRDNGLQVEFSSPMVRRERQLLITARAYKMYEAR